MAESKYTNEDLKVMQAWNLDRKIYVTQTRIIEWYMKNHNKCYVSFSGGKDSTVLGYLVAQVCDTLNCKLVLWFSDTGLEFPELREHVKAYEDYLRNEFPGLDVEVVIDYPKYTRGDKKGKRISFKDIILEKGYPIIGKEVSQVIEEARKNATTGKYTYRIKRLNGELLDKYGDKSIYNCEKWKFLMDAPFKISNKCCNEMKKKPAKRFEKESCRKPIIGTMTEESQARKTAWKIHGCNAFDGNRPISQPISFWTEQDILKYIVDHNLPYPSVYGKILQDAKGKYYTTGYSRTGCMFCGFGCHLEKNQTDSRDSK